MRAALAAIVGLAACGPSARPAEPVVLSNTADPTVYDKTAALQTIRRYRRESSAETWSIELGSDGRFVRRDSADKYEEEFMLADVVQVNYQFKEDWEKPHVANVVLTKSAENRYRYGDVEWSFATDATVAFAFRDKAAAEAVVTALRRLVANR